MVRAGDGFEEFCNAEWPRLVRSLSALCGDRGVAEDLAQEAMTRVAERWRDVRDLESPGGWLHRVGINLAISHLRRRRAEQRAYARATMSDVARDGDLASAIALRDALGTLDPRARSAVTLRYVAGLSADETGIALAMTPGAVRVLTHRALADLRRALGIEVSTDHTEACA